MTEGSKTRVCLFSAEVARRTFHKAKCLAPRGKPAGRQGAALPCLPKLEVTCFHLVHTLQGCSLTLPISVPSRHVLSLFSLNVYNPKENNDFF